MGCNCGARGAAAQKWAVTGTGDSKVDKEYENEASARLALARSGKTGVVKAVAKAVA